MKMLVVGDAMLDSYHFGDVKRISPEAPVPVFLETGTTKYSPGGAANVAINVAAVGVETDFMAIVGNDNYGGILKEQLDDCGINTSLMLRKNDYKTISKRRYIGPGNQQILRVDTEDTKDLSFDLVEKSFSELRSQICSYKLIVLSDYLKGFLTKEITQRIIELANKNHVPILVDVKDKNVSKYEGATILKPNKKELADLTGEKIETIEDAIDAAVKLCSEAACKYVLATLGADGMILCDKTKLIKRTKSVASEVFDVTGAGDTSIAYFGVELAKGKTIEEAMVISNYAAGVQVSKVGTSIVYPDEVYNAMHKEGLDATGSLLDYYEPGGLNPLIRAKESGKKIVFTNGCFDILHAGHISYLREAKKLGDILVVGVNSDESVRHLKGESRPINSLEDRMALLVALEFVDYVVYFNEETPQKLIEILAPDVLVKGGDYIIEDIAGADFVIKNGGEVKILDFVEGKSTSSIVERMKGN